MHAKLDLRKFILVIDLKSKIPKLLFKTHYSRFKEGAVLRFLLFTYYVCC